MHVIISGSGVAGPTLAFFLARSGYKVTILEKAPALLPHGQNVDVQGSALTVIRKMGLLDEVKRSGTLEKGTQFISPSGRPFGKMPVKEGATASPSSEFEILRGDLAAILHRATKDHENITYLFNTTIKSIIHNTDASVRVQLSNNQILDADLLVAADGQWSKTRTASFPSESVAVKHLGTYAVYYTVPRLPSDNPWWNIYIATRSRTISTRPDPHGNMRTLFTLMPSTASQEAAWRNASTSSSRATQEELLHQDFSDAGWQAQRLIADAHNAPDFYFHVIQQIRMISWSNKRVVCIGDAAHAPSPLTGMGSSLAIIGAYVLAGELGCLSPVSTSTSYTDKSPTTTTTITPPSPPSYIALQSALLSYQAIFKPFVEQAQEIPVGIPSTLHPGSWWKRALLNGVLAGVAWGLDVAGWLFPGWMGTAEERDDGFKLPRYEGLEGLGEKEGCGM